MANRFPLVANVSSSRIAELASGDGLDLSGSDIVNAANVTILGTSTLGAVGNVKITGGIAGQAIVTDGLGNLNFATSSASPAGSNTQVQFNNDGAFGTSPFLTFDSDTRRLFAYNTVTNSVSSPGMNSLNITSSGMIGIYQENGSGEDIFIGFGGSTGGNVVLNGGPNVNVTGNINVSTGIQASTSFVSQYVEATTQPTVSAGTLYLDCGICNVFDVSLAQNVTNFVPFNIPISGRAFGFTLKLNIVGSFTITWPASVKWASGTAPTLTTTSGKVDVLEFFTIDGGTTIYGFVAGQNL